MIDDENTAKFQELIKSINKMAESIATLVEGVNKIAYSINMLASNQSMISSEYKNSLEQSSQASVNSCSENMIKAISSVEVATEQLSSEVTANLAPYNDMELIPSDENCKEALIKQSIKENYKQYLNRTGISVLNIGNLKEINPIFSVLASKFAKEYERIRVLLAALKSTQNTKASTSLNLRNRPVDVINSCTSLGKFLYENEFLEEYNYKKAPSYLLRGLL